MAPLTPSLPGYRDLELIAHGTTSLVFRAVQERLNRTVAIKLLLVDQATTADAVARELATMVRLSAQPHIVSIIDTGATEDGRPYTVMEFCEGGSYAQILAERGPLPVDDVVEVGTKIGEALHAAHRAGIIHRDVKPSNVLRSQFGPALADFGIARGPEELAGTLTREMMTPHHASPEALLHQAQSGPSDIYSLASTMWTLLVGHPPFVDPTRPAMDLVAFRDRVLHDRLPAMPRDDVPAWLTVELSRAMAKLPADRHASAYEFAEALRRRSLGLPARPPGGAATAVHVPGLPAVAWPVQPEPAALPPVAPEPVRVEPEPVRLEPVPAPVAEFSARPAVARPTPPPMERPPVAMPTPEPAVAVPENDRGGWLAPPELPPQPARRVLFTEDDEPALNRRGMVIALVAAALLLAAVGGAALLLGGLGPRPAEAGPTTEVTAVPTSVTPGSVGKPTDLRLTDKGSSISLSWRDPTGGTVSFVTIAFQDLGAGDRKYLPNQVIDRGTTTATFTGLDRHRRYCFAVGAVYSATNVATTDAVCTGARPA